MGISKKSSITQLEQIALRKSSNSKYIQHFSERGGHSELSKSRLSVMDRRLFLFVFSPISLKSLKKLTFFHIFSKLFKIA